jgi:hypothetical protein
MKQIYATDNVQRLQDALDYAVTVIESYQMDLRNSPETLTTGNIAALLLGDSLTGIGFCQGSIYTDSLPRIERILLGTSEGR